MEREYDEGDADEEEWREELMMMYETPVNINCATDDEWAKIVFLTERQKEDIQAYIYRYGGMKTLSELMLIGSLDYYERGFLRLFFYAGDTVIEKKPFQLKNMWKYGKNELISTLKVPLYQRDGFKKYDRETLLKTPNKKYLGNSLYHNIRYGYRYADHLYVGFTAEKDAGEPFGSYGNWSYDSFSFHILLKTQGKLRALAVGDYRLNFGMGLVMGRGMLFGKQTEIRFDQGIKRFFSTSELPHFRGAATTIGLHHTEITLFVSRTRNDATLNADGTVATWRKDGYHRTVGELECKHNLTSTMAGAAVVQRFREGYVGVLGYYQMFNRSFAPGTAFYRTYYPSGKCFALTSAYYGYRLSRLSLAGEVAHAFNHHGWAVVNTASYRFNSRYQFRLMQRYYAPRYQSFYSGAVSEGTGVTNENACYLGMEASPVDYLKIETYADVFYFPWPRYGLSHSSRGYDVLFRCRSSLTDRFSSVFTYRVKRKEKFDIYRTYHRLKLQIDGAWSAHWTTHTTLAYNHTPATDGTIGHGLLTAQQMALNIPSGKGKFTFYAAYFRSDDYESRLYGYEPTLLHSYSFPSYSGEGIRISLTGRWNVWRGLSLMCKYGLTSYFDRDAIGSGTQRIGHSSMNDLDFQMKYTF
ncbi:MAG: hypothetical protein NC388_04425 [Clostridium sp.]|nr:hypothetical protein [Clostridium sp.]